MKQNLHTVEPQSNIYGHTKKSTDNNCNKGDSILRTTLD